MKLRFVLVLFSIFLSLAISADRTANNCPDAWTSGSNPPSPANGMGVNIHFTDPQPGEIRMIADAGFRWVRMDFKWDETEKIGGHYDFSAYDRLLTALQPFGIGALLILDYDNQLYDNGAPPRTESSRQAFARWAVAAARHFAGRRVIWEIYNEPNTKMFWPPRPAVDEYVALALAVGRAFRVAVPNEKLIGPATAGIDFPFIEACFNAGLLEYWWAVSVHPYRESDPEAAANDFCRLRKMIASSAERKSAPPAVPGGYADASVARDNDGEIPIISGEWGYSSAWRGMSEEKQGAMLAREMLTNVANRIPISIWYDWRDDGMAPDNPEHHFGLVRNTYQPGSTQVYQPKPAYFAAQTFNQFFNGYRFEKRLFVTRDDDYVLVFAKGGERRIAAWTASTAHRIVIPVGPGSYTVTRHTGELTRSIIASQQELTIEVSTTPQYLARGP
jgi:hypothetical protein